MILTLFFNISIITYARVRAAARVQVNEPLLFALHCTRDKQRETIRRCYSYSPLYTHTGKCEQGNPASMMEIF